MELTESIVLSIVAAAIQEKSILISSHTRLDRAIALTQRTVALLFGRSRPCVVKCEKWTSWRLLENDIQHASRVSEFVLVANPGSLDTQTQAYLTEIVESQRYKILFLGPSKGMRRILRNTIFFQVIFSADADRPVSAEESRTSAVDDQLPQLRARAAAVFISPELKRYAQDLVVFVRSHRFVSKGVPPKALGDLDQLIRILCVFGGLEYATPSIVTAAIRLVIPLKIELCEPFDDISLEYGSDLDIVSSWERNWDCGLLVDTVIETVPAPL